MKTVLLLSFLFAFTVAQPYVSFTTWYYSGCNETDNNWIYDLYLYPADGSCFYPSGGYVVYESDYYIMTANATTVFVSEYDNSDCSDTPYNYTYPIDACQSDGYGVVASVWEEVPDEDYWGDLDYEGSGDTLWETILITNYFDALECPEDNWVSTQVQGFQECLFPYHVYCDDGEINYESCINTDLDCSSGCEPYSDTSTLDDDCTASADITGFWTTYIDYTYSTSFQATCVGGSSSGSTLVASVAVIFAALALVF
jgi:hypothetical protein